ncbi:type III pantothenate kinase [Bacteroidia bacterium]|nr:type III pantothenate kinase [Bacteroidia bacterium]
MGNTAVKCAVVEQGRVVQTLRSDGDPEPLLERMLTLCPGVDDSIVVSTREGADRVCRWLEVRVGRCLQLGPETPTPIVNRYATPATLGYDRLAGAVGAAMRFPGCTTLVVDLGTAITFDVVTAQGEFLGGNISPGAAMRLRALHDHTDSLPLVSLGDPPGMIGSSTEGAILAGVVGGIVHETEGYVARLEQMYGQLKIIFTGGDADFFVKRLNFPIFVSYNLVLEGLNAILEYNNAR